MKIALYSPYLPKHGGGGEKHMLTSAWHLAKNHTVDILIPHDAPNVPEHIAGYERAFNLDLHKVRWVPSRLADRRGSVWSNWRETSRYDVVLALTDGSLFLSGARRNILHIQFPFTQPIRGFWPRWKLRSWHIKNANSCFTKNVVERSWRTHIPYVHYPYVDLAAHTFAPDRKRCRIVSVGRFFDPRHTSGHAKRQDVLVKAFIAGCQRYHWDEHGLSLQLVGAIEPQTVHETWVRELNELAAGYPITFHHDIAFRELCQRYDESLIFWHAAGFHVDEAAQPLKVEHFGMSTIEAMASGCIPIVVNAGGLKETVEAGSNGYLFSTQDELLAATNEVLTQTPNKLRALQQAARQKAQEFSLDRFCATLDEMVGV